MFPIGAFAYSDGLEAATGHGGVATVDDLSCWLGVCLRESIGRLEGPAVWRSFAAFDAVDWTAITEIDDELTAVRPSCSARRSSRAMGLRLLTTWHALRPHPHLDRALALARAGSIGPTLPVACAGAAACAGIARRDAVEGYAYTRLAATISAAMRLMPIGQTDAHTLLARILERVPAIVDAVTESNAPLECFTPVMDIAAMTQQYLHSRVFRS